MYEIMEDDTSNITEITNVSLFAVENKRYQFDLADDLMAAIMADDLEVMCAIFKMVEKSDAKRILSKIPSNAPVCGGIKTPKQYVINCPWILASCYGAKNILHYFYTEKWDIFSQDKDGNNCIHNMIILSAVEGKCIMY